MRVQQRQSGSAGGGTGPGQRDGCWDGLRCEYLRQSAFDERVQEGGRGGGGEWGGAEGAGSGGRGLGEVGAREEGGVGGCGEDGVCQGLGEEKEEEVGFALGVVWCLEELGRMGGRWMGWGGVL